VAPSGTTSLVNLAVNLSGVDKKLDLITVRKPVPQFSIELPPRGAVLGSPNLFVRGTAPARASVTINKWVMPVAANGAFSGTVRLPEGPSVIDVAVVLGPPFRPFPKTNRRNASRVLYKLLEVLRTIAYLSLSNGGLTQTVFRSFA